MINAQGKRLGGQEQKGFPTLGTKFSFHVNSAKIFSLFCPPTWPGCHVVVNQAAIRPAALFKQVLNFPGKHYLNTLVVNCLLVDPNLSSATNRSHFKTIRLH